MTTYVIKNCHSQFLGKDLEWTDSDGTPLFHTPHKDVALNQLIEMNAKNIQLRAEVVCCEVDTKGRPLPPQEAAA